MKTNELIRILQQYPNIDVVILSSNGLYCPVEKVKTSAETVVIKAKDMSAFVIESDFKPLIFKPSVEKVYIIDNDK